jgi:hypothetical protein
MLRFVLFTAALLVMADYALAQAPTPEQCEQIKQAVAQYGYAAARRYAVVNYGPEAARVGDLCFAPVTRRVIGRRVTGNGTEFERNRKQPD